MAKSKQLKAGAGGEVQVFTLDGCYVIKDGKGDFLCFAEPEIVTSDLDDAEDWIKGEGEYSDEDEDEDEDEDDEPEE